MTKDLNEVLSETYASDSATRKNAIRELCPCELKIDRAEVWDRLLDLTRDDDPAVRRLAVHALIDGSPRAREQDVIASLEALRGDSNLKLRRHARKLLAHYHRTGRINVAAGHP